MGAPYEPERVPDSAIVDFIAFVVESWRESDDAIRTRMLLVSIKNILARYDKLAKIEAK